MGFLRRAYEFDRIVDRRPIVRRALTPYQLDAVVLPFVRRVEVPLLLRELEDRRAFHPLGKAAMAAVVGGRGRVEMRPSLRGPGMSAASGIARSGIMIPERAYFGIETPWAPGWIGYKNVIPSALTLAKRVVPCIRRKARREVLAARNKLGAKHKRGKRNAYSDVNC